MVTFLIVALIITTFMSLVLGWICHRLYQMMDDQRAYVEGMLERCGQQDRLLYELLRTLDTSEGGISKRISESAEIAEAIYSLSPDLFERCSGLAYWLHANDQFLLSLYALVAEGIDPDKRRRVDGMETRRRDIFDRIYKG